MDGEPRSANRILVVTGPPGAGKSTVAPLVTARLGPKSVCIEADWFWTTIRSGFVAPWEPDAHDQNKAVITAVVSAAVALASGGYDVVVEGIFEPWTLPLVTHATAEHGFSLDYVVLRPDLATCLSRVNGRADETPRVTGHPPLAESGPVIMLYEHFANLGPHEPHVVDASACPPDQIADRIIRALDQQELGWE